MKNTKHIIYDAIDLMIDNIDPLVDGLLIEWSANIGYGRIIIKQPLSDGRIIIDSESMSKEFVIAVLTKLVDKSTIK